MLATKFRVPPDDVQAFREEILGFAKRVMSGETIDAVQADPTDNRILECAVASASRDHRDGDDDLLRLGNFRGIAVVKVAAFLAGFRHEAGRKRRDTVPIGRRRKACAVRARACGVPKAGARQTRRSQ